MKIKKILAIALAVASVISVTALAVANNTPAFHSAETTETAEKVKTHNFENTYYQLKKNNKLNIGYLGGSITYGVGATDNKDHPWASLVTEWFKAKFPNATITGNNVGIGGTGTVFGQYRIIEDFKLVSETEKPDLIFLEFAINDAYDGTDETAAKKNMNTILNSIYNYAPNADVVILFTTDSGKSEEGGSEHTEGKNIQKAHQEVADVYGIPSIDIGGMLLDDMSALPEANGKYINVWSKYFPDNVHPNDMGHLKYASYITHYLDCIFSAKTKVANELTAAYIPNNAAELFGTPLENPHTVNLKGQTAPAGFSINSNGVISTSNPGSFKIKFTGTSLSLWANRKPTGGKVTVTIDDNEPKTINLCYSNPYATIVLASEGLEDKEHTAEIVIEKTTGGSDVVIDRFCLTGKDLSSKVTIVE